MEELAKDKTLIHIKREFPCAVKPLFEAFLSANDFRQWFSPPGLEAGKFTLDPVVGGIYTCEFMKQNEYFLTIKGKYIEIERYKTISFSLIYDPDVSEIGECRVTVNFVDKGNISEIILNQEIYKNIDAEGRTKGWDYMFSKLKEILNNN